MINERCGTDFTDADQYFFDQIVQAAIEDDTLKQAAAANPEDKFSLVFKRVLETLFVDRMEQNEDIFVRFMNDQSFKNIVTNWMVGEVYKNLHESKTMPQDTQ